MQWRAWRGSLVMLAPRGKKGHELFGYFGQSAVGKQVLTQMGARSVGTIFIHSEARVKGIPRVRARVFGRDTEQHIRASLVLPAPLQTSALSIRKDCAREELCNVCGGWLGC